MKKVIRLTESDLAKIVRQVIKENKEESLDLTSKLNDIFFGNDPMNITSKEGDFGYLSGEHRLSKKISPKQRIRRIENVISQLEDYIQTLKNAAYGEESFVDNPDYESNWGDIDSRNMVPDDEEESQDSVTESYIRKQLRYLTEQTISIGQETIDAQLKDDTEKLRIEIENLKNEVNSLNSESIKKREQEIKNKIKLISDKTIAKIEKTYDILKTKRDQKILNDLIKKRDLLLKQKENLKNTGFGYSDQDILNGGDPVTVLDRIIANLESSVRSIVRMIIPDSIQKK